MTEPRYPWDESSLIHDFDYICCLGVYDHPHVLHRELELRLVCKAFDHAMTRLYFQHKYATFRTWENTATSRLQKYIIEEGAKFPPCIKRLQIMLSESRLSPDGLFEKRDVENNPGLAGKLALLVANTSAFVPRIEEAVSKSPTLKRLVITLEENWRSAPLEVDQRDDEDCGLKLDLDFLQLIRSNIASIFSSPRVHLTLLTYLRLTLPSAYDIATIGACIRDDMAMQLRHLFLEYIDGTGPGGDRAYDFDERSINDEHGSPLYSNLQTRFPNTDYMNGICTLVSRCRNLESLGLRGTQYCNLESLVWRPTKDGLRNLYIDRVRTPSLVLLALLSPSTGISESSSTSRIVSVDLSDVDLHGSAWSTIYDHLGSSPLLAYVDVKDIPIGRSDQRSVFNMISKVDAREGYLGEDLQDLYRENL